MESEVQRTPYRVPARLMSRRSFLTLAGRASSLVLLAACGGGAPAPPAAPTQAPPSAPQPTAAPPATGAAPAAATAPAVARAEPKGRVVYAWHTTISPAWVMEATWPTN